MPDLESQTPDDRIYGIWKAKVTSLKDDLEGLSRVTLTIPVLGDELVTDLALVMTPMGGAKRGMFFMPEVDDEVLVTFIDGDFSRPIVLGSFWSTRELAPHTITNEKNDRRFIMSRSGHLLELNDTEKAEKVTLMSKGGHVLTLDDTDQKGKVTLMSKAAHSIEMTDEAGKETIVIRSKSGHCITLKDASGGEQVIIQDKSGGQQIILESTGTISINAKSEVKIKAAKVTINDGTMGTARQNDLIESSMTDDPAFWVWVQGVATHTHLCGAPGASSGPPMALSPPPASCKGKITKASGTVKVGD